ncbi:MAG: copper homeostasis protein CutC [Gemmatimonadales bacterium]
MQGKGPAAAGALLEACVDSLPSALAAESGGAGRIELCERLDVGGLTPAPALVAALVACLRIPLVILVRPRDGDFVYDRAERAALGEGIRVAQELGARGVAIAALHPDGSVDADLTGKLVELARPLEVTFHRAFDACPDQIGAIEILVGLGVKRVLTSGGARTAELGIGRLRELVQASGGRATILAGGGVSPGNALRIVRETAVREVHAHSALLGPSRVTDPALVRTLVESLQAPD